MKYRLYNRIYAYLNGYFWIACPICGEYFGGHEWGDAETQSIWRSGGFGEAVCPSPECIAKAKEISQPIKEESQRRWAEQTKAWEEGHIKIDTGLDHPKE